MFEDKITLDKETFKVLSSDTRIQVLKLLSRRRMTLSELASSLGMSVSSVKEHLDSLVSAGLIRQIDDGHKWKYYQLTRKGKEIVNPVEKKVLIVLAISVIIAVSSFAGMLSPEPQALGARLPAAESMAEAQTALPAAGQPPIHLMAVLAISVLVAGMSLGYIVAKR